MTPSKLGIRVEEERGPDQLITRLGTARTAFVGRTLRGPAEALATAVLDNAYRL